MIVIRLSGGLGNQMFEYAATKHLALRNNTVLKMDLTSLNRRNSSMRHTPREYALDMFSLDQRFFSPVERMLFKLKVLPLKKAKEADFQTQPGHTVAYNGDVLELLDNCYLEGIFPSPRYFQEIVDVIRQDFSFREPLAGEAKVFSGKIVEGNSVCVHVRRGDYVISASANQTHGLCPLSYYQAALSLLRERGVTDPQLFVFSDDIPWCQENLKLDAPTTYVGPEYAGEKDADHFKLMTACKHFIIPNSTFSWWAAWLSTASAEKVVVAPRKWTQRDTGFYPVPDDWLTIDADLGG